MAPDFLQPHFLHANCIPAEPKFPLLYKHPVSFHMLRAFAHSCSTCISLPHSSDVSSYLIYQRNSFSAFKNSTWRSFPMKALTVFSRVSDYLFKACLYVNYNLFNCVIIHSTIFFLIEHHLCPRHSFMSESANFFVKG